MRKKLKVSYSFALLLLVIFSFFYYLILHSNPIANVRHLKSEISRTGEKLDLLEEEKEKLRQDISVMMDRRHYKHGEDEDLS